MYSFVQYIMRKTNIHLKYKQLNEIRKKSICNPEKLDKKMLLEVWNSSSKRKRNFPISIHETPTIGASRARERGEVAIAGRRDPLIETNAAIGASVGATEGHHLGWP